MASFLMQIMKEFAEKGMWCEYAPSIKTLHIEGREEDKANNIEYTLVKKNNKFLFIEMHSPAFFDPSDQAVIDEAIILCNIMTYDYSSVVLLDEEDGSYYTEFMLHCPDRKSFSMAVIRDVMERLSRMMKAMKNAMQAVADGMNADEASRIFDRNMAVLLKNDEEEEAE